MSKKFIFTHVLLCLFLSLYIYPTAAQVEEGRPVVILLTPDTTYAGTLDDDSPLFQTPAMQGLYESDTGLLADGNALELVLLNLFYNGLAVSPEDQMVIIAIPGGNSRDTWLRLAAILFDRFEVPELYIHEAGKWDDAITPELTPGDKLYWISRNKNQ